MQPGLDRLQVSPRPFRGHCYFRSTSQGEHRRQPLRYLNVVGLKIDVVLLPKFEGQQCHGRCSPPKKASELLSTTSRQLKREMLDLPRTQSPAVVSSTISRPPLVPGDISRPGSSPATPLPKRGRLGDRYDIAAGSSGRTMPRPMQLPEKASELLSMTPRQSKREMLHLPRTRSTAGVSSAISRPLLLPGDVSGRASSPATLIPKQTRCEDRRGFVAEIRGPIMPRPMQPARKA
ncbi:hypothetical protein QAD02_004227 [Eretmocerus hayati]|uniref:Uncharacterized protein n=1 Tax=Eretmocerus hayati TaxID=131215 RepID=A0ACC2NP98_9HYME|nr:hypothetical protein QAD02_004227 [Eretmocerus hayati]